MIRFDSVSKRFGPVPVLDRLDLEIPDGQCTAIMGRSGCGKSVLLKHIVGLLMPDEGQVTVDGAVVHDLDPDDLDRLRARFGYVFQFAALLDSMSLGDNIRLGLRRRGLDRDTIEARVIESLAVVELTGWEERLPAELSGGMRKRAGIARAIALRPDYILFDEPTTGLDPVTTASIGQLIQRIRRESRATIVMVSHDLASVYAVADRIALMAEGRIRQAGTVAEIRNTADPVVRQFIEGRPESLATAR